jgi:large subunit ribosomal protein L18
MAKLKSRNEARKKRHLRIRNRLVGTPLKPRLSVFRSSKHIYAQIIDDINGVTLVQASSKDKDLTVTNGGNIDAAKLVGELVAKRAKDAKIDSVVFDRSGYLYHGRVKALAEAAREAGLVL